MSPSAYRSVLEEAQEIIHGARNQDYGHPADNHGTTAAFWSVYVEAVQRRTGKLELTPEDVCFLNILQKISRQVTTGRITRDCLVDTCGYSGNVEMIQDRREGRG